MYFIKFIFVIAIGTVMLFAAVAFFENTVSQVSDISSGVSSHLSVIEKTVGAGY